VKHMRSYRAFLVWSCLLLPILSPRAQEAPNAARMGLPQDWTQHHIIFSRQGLAANPGLVYGEARVLHQAMRRWLNTSQQATDAAATVIGAPQRDWNVSLGLGRIAPNMFPAKYSFDPSAAPSCANDYVVFGLNRVGNANQANLVAFNNLYSGAGPAGLAAPRRLSSSPTTSARSLRAGFLPRRHCRWTAPRSLLWKAATSAATSSRYSTL